MDGFLQAEDYLQSSSIYTLFVVVELNLNPPSHPQGLYVPQQAEGIQTQQSSTLTRDR
jgi:hypothetical protein